MVTPFRRSLRAKTVVVVLLTTFAALTLAGIALLIYDVRSYSAFLLADADSQADLLADITAPALAFDDPVAARTNLELLSQRQEIDAAAVFSADGSLFAQYTRSGESVRPTVGAPGVTINGQTLSVFKPVVRNDEVLGTVFLLSSYEVSDRIRDYILILLGVMVPSFLVAAAIALWLARTVSGPLVIATEVARDVVERRDFTRRAPRTTDDEIGVFVGAFNTMVAEVGQRAAELDQRAAELEASNRALTQETEERRVAEAALRRADQRKDEFLATLAHELRNPLAPMVNSMDLLESRALPAELRERAHTIIRRQLSHMVRLIDDLLEVSRITRGKLVMRKDSIELGQVLQNAIDTVRPLFDQQQQTLTADLPTEPVHLEGDAVRLCQVFSNLLNNASKFSDKGKRVSLTCAVGTQDVRVRITDEGMGISKEVLPEIFDMFMQGPTAKGPHSGLGVGLALSRSLVELHGGAISAESAGPGQGSAFTVTLPSTAVIAPAIDAHEHPARTSVRRILLVDDNVDYALTLSYLLKALGHDVRMAHNGADALHVAREQRPELGFLDIGLPDTTGYELAQALHAQPETADTILVAVSGWGQDRDRERSRQAGFALHLVKPVGIENIQAAMATLMAASGT